MKFNVLKVKNKPLLRKTVQCVAILFALHSLSGCVAIGAVTAASTGVMLAEERSMGNIVDDSTIKTKIAHVYSRKEINELFYPISIDVSEGRVLLTGRVKNKEYSEEAVKIAWAVRGVKEVINELKIKGKDKKKLSDSTSNSWIKTQARSKLLFEKGIKSVNYSIGVNEGTVYLLGIAQSKEELDKVIEVVRNIRGVKRVVSHVLLKDDPRRSHKS